MKSAIALLALVIVARVAESSIVTIPPDLNPGDTYRLVFVTDGTRDGASSNIVDYDAFVAAEAQAIPALNALSTTWTAIASTQSAIGSWDAHDHTGTNPIFGAGVSIYRLDGVQIAANNADFWDGFLDASISITPSGLLSTSMPAVWTGSNPDGTVSSSGFLGRNPITSPDSLSVYGDSLSTDGSWITSGDADNAILSFRFYGISDELTVIIPEPSNFLISLVGLVILSWRRRHT